MALQVFIDGKFLKKEEAKISVFDHGFLYGDGVFEGIRAYNGRVFRLREHTERLFRSARAIALEIPMSMDEIESAILKTIEINGFVDAYARVVVSRGIGNMGLDPRSCPRPSVIIIADGFLMYPESMYTNGLEVITVSTRRNSAHSLDPSIKSLNYLNNILAKIEVNRAGLGEGLMLNAQGYLTEATADNVFLVKGGKLLTPPVSAGILEGVTRNTVIELATKMGIPVSEELLTQYDVYNAQECFLTGTGAEVIPVVKVDGRVVGDGHPGELTKKLIAAFRNLVATEGVSISKEG